MILGNWSDMVACFRNLPIAAMENIWYTLVECQFKCITLIDYVMVRSCDYTTKKFCLGLIHKIITSQLKAILNQCRALWDRLDTYNLRKLTYRRFTHCDLSKHELCFIRYNAYAVAFTNGSTLGRTTAFHTTGQAWYI